MNLIRRVGELSDIAIQQEDKRIRIEQRYGQGKMEMILAIERAFKKYAYSRGEKDLETLLRMLRDGQEGRRTGMLNRKANYYGKKYKNLRLSSHDFEEAFWEEAWRIVENYS
jgi:hypothetical protein